MKKFVLGLMILGSFSLLADEKKVRLSEKSMSDFSIQKAECIDGTAQAASIEIELSLNTKIKLIFNKSIYYGCDYHVRDFNINANEVADSLSSILYGDTEVQETNGEDSEIYCTKKIGYITHDSELGIGRDFKVKNVATTCP